MQRFSLVVVPVANPIGLARWGTDTVQGRFEDSDHINCIRRYYGLAEELREANSKLWWALAQKFPEAAIPPAC